MIKNSIYKTLTNLLFIIVFSMQSACASSYEKGLREYNSKHYKLAVKFFMLSAEEGDSKAQYMLANMYNMGYGMPIDMIAAERWYRRSAQQENVDAQYMLGTLLMSGPRTSDSRIKEGIDYLKKAALNGNVDAQYRLGRMYELGYNVRKDFIEARKWYLMAVAQGHQHSIEAVNNLNRVIK